MDGADYSGELRNINKTDALSHLASYLPKKEIAKMREVSTGWKRDIEEKVHIYKIGFDRNGWSRWDGETDLKYGWGIEMQQNMISGEISGGGINNGDSSNTARRKVIFGDVHKGVYTINVLFPSTQQENVYVGTIGEEDGKTVFRGTYRLVKSIGGLRKAGDGGEIWGVVERKL